jgi:hypothetical protein
MRSYSFGLALAFVACLAGAPHAVHAADAPSDTFCPRAVPKLAAFDALARDGGKDLAKVATVAGETAHEYQLCIGEATTRVVDEPRINYDRVRAAQFLVVQGRALAATGDSKGALQAFKDARSLADFVAKWEPSSQGFSQSNSGSGYSSSRGPADHNGSRYREAATQIVTAADSELATLIAHPQAQATTKP